VDRGDLGECMMSRDVLLINSSFSRPFALAKARAKANSISLPHEAHIHETFILSQSQHGSVLVRIWCWNLTVENVLHMDGLGAPSLPPPVRLATARRRLFFFFFARPLTYPLQHVVVVSTRHAWRSYFFNLSIWTGEKKKIDLLGNLIF
jgi:hypothetical protein